MVDFGKITNNTANNVTVPELVFRAEGKDLGLASSTLPKNVAAGSTIMFWLRTNSYLIPITNTFLTYELEFRAKSGAAPPVMSTLTGVIRPKIWAEIRQTE